MTRRERDVAVWRMSLSPCCILLGLISLPSGERWIRHRHHSRLSSFARQDHQPRSCGEHSTELSGVWSSTSGPWVVWWRKPSHHSAAREIPRIAASSLVASLRSWLISGRIRAVQVPTVERERDRRMAYGASRLSIISSGLESLEHTVHSNAYGAGSSHPQHGVM